MLLHRLFVLITIFPQGRRRFLKNAAGMTKTRASRHRTIDVWNLHLIQGGLLSPALTLNHYAQSLH